jgi:glycosyltransferase 2 family protein
MTSPIPPTNDAAPTPRPHTRSFLDASSAAAAGAAGAAIAIQSAVRQIVGEYFWFVVKNVVGWVFILGSLPVGLTLPGPFGLPLFLIGFALVWFPGKRRITSRVMSGRPMHVEPGLFGALVVFVAVWVSAGLIWLLELRYEQLLHYLGLDVQFMQIRPFVIVGIISLTIFVSWIVLRLAVPVLNFILRRVPRFRRAIRPWLRKYGINLLPPRRRALLQAIESDHTEPPPTPEAEAESEQSIIELSPRYQRNFASAWRFTKPWLTRIFGFVITAWILIRIGRPIIEHWHDQAFRDRLDRIRPSALATAVLMFSIFLFAFRSLAWRHILASLGYRLPIRVTTRIWSHSELTRYVPGSVLQMISRVYLIKPYGIRGSVCTVSQILELSIFLLANLILAVACLLYFGIKQIQGPARFWLIASSALVPILALALHPRIFYPVADTIMRYLGKPPLTRHVSFRSLVGTLAWNFIGLLWQSIAVFLITRDALQLKHDWWWIIAGAYSLAWCAGFLAFWAPGGIGVRELVFVTAMQLALPNAVRQNLQPQTLAVFLASLSILLRLWTTTGELLLATVAWFADYRGALGRPDAPGRAATMKK